MILTRCGYNCINLSLNENYQNYRLATVTDRDYSTIYSRVDANIKLLSDTIAWNIREGYRIFRMSSNIVPFIGHPLMQDILTQSDLFKRPCIINEMSRIKQMITESKTRLTIHPSQMNVLNSPDSDITRRTLIDITNTTKLLKHLGGDTLLLHIGGVYGDKEESMKRFITNVSTYVPDEVKQVLAFENDDKSYNSEDVVNLTQQLGLPWVYDIHHENIYPSNTSAIELLRNFPPTKYHISDGKTRSEDRSHNDYVSTITFKKLCYQIEMAGLTEADIMFEAKQKNLAVSRILEPIGNGYWKLK